MSVIFSFLRRKLSTTNVPEIPRMQRGLPKRAPITGVKNIIAVASGKGGVGKSTITAKVNLTVALSKLGRKVGILDADLFGPSIPRLMNLRAPPEGIQVERNFLRPLVNYGVKCMSMGFLVPETSPVVWRGLMVMKGIEQLVRQVHWEPLDILVIDMPPGTGDTQLSISQLVELSGALIVTTPQDIAVVDARKGVEMFRKVQILGIVKNMDRFNCPNCHVSTHIYQAGPGNDFHKLITDVELPILAEIPIEPELALNSDSGIPIVISNPNSKSSQEFMRLAESIINKL